MDTQIDRERGIHGTQWNVIHEGYFSRPDVAMELVNVVKEYVERSHPDVVVDLGGGTGVILSALRELGFAKTPRLVDLDLSKDQLEEAAKHGLDCLLASVPDFQREMTVSNQETLLAILRSVLHYFGKDGLPGLLSHLRAQLGKAEYLIHQTACFRNQADATCLNQLYQLMHTPKWYPSIDELTRHLSDAGWHVIDILPAKPLPLTSHDLSIRYRLQQEEIEKITSTLLSQFGEKENVFQVEGNGFRAFLHYWIFVCQ